MKPADIHRQLCEVCGEDGMSDSMVRRWDEGRENVHNDPQSSRQSMGNDDLVCAKELNIQENSRFTI
jgi:hypothetical protein